MSAPPWSAALKPVVDLLGLKAGLSFSSEECDRKAVEQAIGESMQSADCSSTKDYVTRLNNDEAAFDDLLRATTTDGSSLFREPGQFRIVSDLILPDIRRRRGPGHKIRIWSAGCGAGEEAYSLAILLHRSGALSQASILGTDISEKSLEQARQGTYQLDALEGEYTDMAKPYLTEKEGLYHVNATMKKSTRFETLNLALDHYPSIGSGTRGMDLIFCRNVLTYFNERTLKTVVGRIFRSLAEGGWLIISSSDPPVFEYESFDFVPTEHGLAYRKANLSDDDELEAELTAAAEEESMELLSETVIPKMNFMAAEPTPSVEATTRATSRSADPPSVRSEPPSPVRDRGASRGTSATASTPRVGNRAATVGATTGTTRRFGRKALIEAKEALAGGDYERAAELTSDLRGEGAAIHIRALIRINIGRATEACAAATKKRPLSQELKYLSALLLMEKNEHREAAETLQRVLYLDDTLAQVHFLLGSALRKLGDVEGATTAFRRTVELCDRLPQKEAVALSEDVSASQLRAQAVTELSSVQ